VRRVEAITGTKALEYLMNEHKELTHAKDAAQVQGAGILPQWIENKKKEYKDLEKSVHSLKSQNLDPESYIKAGKKFSDGTYVFVKLETDDRKVLSDFSDKIKDKIQSGVILTIGEGPSGYPIIVSVSKNLIGKYNAGKILGDVAQTLGGKGGGRPDFAQGSAPSLENLEKAKQQVASSLQ
jgi:alanyl-tRNA synthetase